MRDFSHRNSGNKRFFPPKKRKGSFSKRSSSPHRGEMTTIREDRTKERDSRSNRNNHHRGRADQLRRNKNRGQRPRNIQEAHSSYAQLWQKIFKLRQNIFEQYYKMNKQQREKVESSYYQLLRNLNQFTQRLPYFLQEEFGKDYSSYQEDNIFSLNHPGEGISDPPELSPSPHILPSQQNRISFKDDFDDQEGSIEDYRQYKISKENSRA